MAPHVAYPSSHTSRVAVLVGRPLSLFFLQACKTATPVFCEVVRSVGPATETLQSAITLRNSYSEGVSQVWISSQ
jgi:hypothetical protein